MSGFQRFFGTIASTVAVALFVTSLPLGAARAALVTTERVIEETATASAAAGERQRLMAVLERDDVRRQMEALGVDPEEAAARLAGLSDAEVQRIAGQLDALPAGEGVLEGLVVVGLLVLLGLFVTDLLGITDVFPFIRPAAR